MRHIDKSRPAARRLMSPSLSISGRFIACDQIVARLNDFVEGKVTATDQDME
jgi:hypothetical protein